jgi:hypothetical protein
VGNSIQSFYNMFLAPIRAELGEAAYDALVARGQAMSLQEAFEYALA